MKDHLFGHSLPAPLTDEERPAVLAKLRAFEKPERADPLAWAHRLRAREIACERLSLFQRSAWREALGYSERER